MAKSGGTAEPDSVVGLTATFITSKGGQGQMNVIKGMFWWESKVKPQRDLARLLLAAALASI